MASAVLSLVHMGDREGGAQAIGRQWCPAMGKQAGGRCDAVVTGYYGSGLLRGEELRRRRLVVYILLEHVVSLPATDFTVPAVLSLVHVICRGGRGSTGRHGQVGGPRLRSQHLHDVLDQRDGLAAPRGGGALQGALVP